MTSKKIPLISKIFLALSINFLIPFTGFAAFSDVPATHPQFKAISSLEAKKILTGFPDGTFKPEKTMNKIEFLKLIFSDIGYKPNALAYQTGFKDVPPTSWYAGYVKKALELKLINPSQVNENFQPEKSFSKVEALRLTFALEGIATPYYSEIKQADLFQDTKPNSAFAYIALAAKKNGIISVKNPKIFGPFKNLTRGDGAEIIYQIGAVKEGKETQNGVTVVTPSEEAFMGLDPLSARFINNPKFPILLDVWKKAHTDYYYQEKIDENELVYGAIDGLVNKLGDRYSVFQEPLQANELSDYLQGELQGIGVQVNVLDGQLVITTILPNSPAEKVGLKSGDIIDKIEGNKVSEMTLENVLKMIKGEIGTKVHLTIIRQGTSLEFDVPREKISIASIHTRTINGNIAYMNITQFITTSEEEFDKQLAALLLAKPKGFIIDLRGNPGGYLNIANEVLNHFVEAGKIIVSTKTLKGQKMDFISKGEGELNKYPIMVLIDGATASAAEIMAGALQDYQLATLIGETSFGKGSVQQLFDYPDNSLLKISIAHWLTPLGKDINDIGLKADIEVKRTKEDILNGKDPQLDRAIIEMQKR